MVEYAYISMRITLKQVAQVAGVHQTTASRALRGQNSIPEATRQRIRRIAASRLILKRLAKSA